MFIIREVEAESHPRYLLKLEELKSSPADYLVRPE